MKKIEWLSVLRGLTILLVVMFHIQLIDMSTGQNHQFCEDMSFCFTPFRMPLFIFTSGGLLYVSRIEKEWSVRNLYIDKFRRIMVPFFFFVCVYYFVKMTVNQYVKTSVDFSLCDFLTSFFIFENHPSAPLWFLATLMTLMLLYPLFCLLCRKVVYSMIFLLFSIIIYYIDFTEFVNYNYFFLFKLNRFLVFFFFGIFFFRFKLYKYLDNWYVSILSLIVYVTLFIYERGLACSMVGIILMISICLKIAKYFPRLFSSYREYIYQIYLLSIPFQAFVELILWKKLFYNEQYFYLFYVLNLLIGLYVPVIISKTVEKTNNRYLKMCFGLKYTNS